MKLKVLRHKSMPKAISEQPTIYARKHTADKTQLTCAFYIRCLFFCRSAMGPTNYRKIVKFQSNFSALFIDAANIAFYAK